VLTGTSVLPYERYYSLNMSPQLSVIEYKILVEQAPIMIWRSNISAECDYFNERWLRFRGRSMEQEYGNNWAQGVHADDLAACFSTYMNAFGKREAFEMYYRLLRHDGVYRWIFDRGVPFFSDTGEFQGYIGSCIDVTERIEAQRTLNEARERELADLRGLLPICMACKRIRDGDGTWRQLELYISMHSHADFTHGVCPECAARMTQ
jgi:PAS domain S-box-containing protein